MPALPRRAFPISKGLPMPPVPPRRPGNPAAKGRAEVYPFSKMEIGDSFFVPRGIKNNLIASFTHQAYHSQRFFRAFTATETWVGSPKVPVPGLRVFRVSQADGAV